jgi:hypothetical protein
MQYGVEEGAKSGFERVDAVLQHFRSTPKAPRHRGRTRSVLSGSMF